MTALTDLTDCVVNYTDQNMFLGQSSGGSITAANNSTSLGYLALRDVTSGGGNTAIGNQAMKGLTTGIQNVAVGTSALFNDSFNGDSNVAIGHSSMLSATTANHNVAIGLSALSNLTTGDNNILIGTADTVGTQLTTGSNNILIGHQIAPSSSSVTNELNIGGTVVGNTSTKVLELQANLDANAKKITDLADPTTAQDAATKQYVDDTASAESGKWTVTTVTPSGDDVDLLTNIDSEGYTEIEIYGYGIGASNSRGVSFQLGDSGGYETSGYVGRQAVMGGAVSDLSADMIKTPTVGAGLTLSFSLKMIRSGTGSNAWVFHAQTAVTSNDEYTLSQGTKTTSAATTSIRMHSDTTTGAFNAGTVIVMAR